MLLPGSFLAGVRDKVLRWSSKFTYDSFLTFARISPMIDSAIMVSDTSANQKTVFLEPATE